MTLSFGRFQFFFFYCVGRSVIDVLSDFQLDSLTFVEVTPYCVHLSLCVAVDGEYFEGDNIDYDE